MIKRRIPLDDLQKALYELLSSKQSTAVYDDVPEDASFPCITFGSFTAKQNGSKDTDINDVTLQIDIWSEYQGKAEINGIVNDVCMVLSNCYIDLSASNFKTLRQSCDFVEVFPEDSGGYHGVITFSAKIQTTGGW